MKNFYSCVDTLIPSPLSEQHLIIKKKAEKEGGLITAYASEEFRTVKSQPWKYDAIALGAQNNRTGAVQTKRKYTKQAQLRYPKI